MSSPTPICAIIVTYNGMRWIQKCIKSLQQGNEKVDIIVVDNGSTDGTVQFLETQPNVKLFKNESNIGFGKANNEGLQYAFEQGYAFFFLLNQDAWLASGSLDGLIAALIADSQYGILSPVHFDGQGDRLDPGFAKYMRLRRSSGFYQDFKRDGLQQKIYEVAFVNAAAWLIRRDCLMEVGLFHPLFKHYGEDDNYIHRVHFAGRKVGVLGCTTLFHDRLDRYKNRVDRRAKFRSMVLMAHLNPLTKRGNVTHWLISMGNLISLCSFRDFLATLQFIGWGVTHYFKFEKEVRVYNSKEYNPLISQPEN